MIIVEILGWLSKQKDVTVVNALKVPRKVHQKYILFQNNAIHKCIQGNALYTGKVPLWWTATRNEALIFGHVPI